MNSTKFQQLISLAKKVCFFLLFMLFSLRGKKPMINILKIIFVFIIFLTITNPLPAERIRSWESGNVPVFSKEKTSNRNSPKKQRNTHHEKLENRIELLEIQVDELETK